MRVNELHPLRMGISLYLPVLILEHMYRHSVSSEVNAGVWMLMAKRSLVHASTEYHSVVSVLDFFDITYIAHTVAEKIPKKRPFQV